MTIHTFINGPKTIHNKKRKLTKHCTNGWNHKINTKVKQKRKNYTQLLGKTDMCYNWITNLDNH